MANRNSKKWLWTLIILGILIIIGMVILMPRKPNLGPPTVGYDTTRLTGPLRADGTVDYIAALNQMYSKGVTPDNNAAVLLLRAIGPDAMNAQIRDEAYRLLGITPPPAKGNYFVSLDDYVKSIQASTKPSTPPATSQRSSQAPPSGITPAPMSLSPDAMKTKDAQSQMIQAHDRPWSAEEFPELAGWLKANEAPLTLAIEASKRPRYFFPLISTTTPPMLSTCLFPSLKGYRDISKMLSIRAMRKAHEGDIAGARADLLAVHRLSRLIGRGPWLMDYVVGNGIHLLPCVTTRDMLAKADIDANSARAILADLQSLDPLPDPTDVFDIFERWNGLDFISRCSSHGPKMVYRAIEGHYVADLDADWDWSLKKLNELSDEYVAAMKLPTFAAQKAALDRHRAKLLAFISDLDGSYAIAEGTSWVRRHLGLDKNRRFTQTQGEFERDPQLAVIKQLAPHLYRVNSIRHAAKMQFDLTLLATALAAHKAERGEYPAALAELKPEYLKTIPNDLFIEKPLHYTRTADGYVLYSVGPDMTDDGGKSGDYDEDIVVKVE